MRERFIRRVRRAYLYLEIFSRAITINVFCAIDVNCRVARARSASSAIAREIFPVLPAGLVRARERTSFCAFSSSRLLNRTALLAAAHIAAAIQMTRTSVDNRLICPLGQRGYIHLHLTRSLRESHRARARVYRLISDDLFASGPACRSIGSVVYSRTVIK